MLEKLTHGTTPRELLRSELTHLLTYLLTYLLTKYNYVLPVEVVASFGLFSSLILIPSYGQVPNKYLLMKLDSPINKSV